MEKDSLFKRYLVFIAGLYFLAMGITLIVHSSLGTTPISSMNYVLSLNTSLSLGTWTFIVNLLMIIIQLWLARGKYGTRKDTIEILQAVIRHHRKIAMLGLVGLLAASIWLQ